MRNKKKKRVVIVWSGKNFYPTKCAFHSFCIGMELLGGKEANDLEIGPWSARRISTWYDWLAIKLVKRLQKVWHVERSGKSLFPLDLNHTVPSIERKTQH